MNSELLNWTRRSARTAVIGCVLILLLSQNPVDASAQEFVGKFIPDNLPEYPHGFGYAVAVLGDIAAAGNGAGASSSFDPKSGVYLFRKGFDENGFLNWRTEAHLEAPSYNVSAFGYGVAIARTPTDEFVFVGAPIGRPDPDVVYYPGIVEVFRNDADGWEKVQTLSPPNADSLSIFGLPIAASGNLLAVPALNATVTKDGNAVQGAGAIYLYRFNGTLWVLEAGPLFLPEAETNDQLGNEIAAYSNGAQEFVVAGAGNTSSEAGARTGSAHVFRPIDGIWQRTQVIRHADPRPGDFFGGNGIALNAKWLCIGVPNRDDADPANIQCNSGIVYIYRYDAGFWVEEQVLNSPIGACGERFGVSLSISGDLLAVGATGSEATPGTLYFYRFNGDSWERLGDGVTGEFAGDIFGVVAMDSENVIVGAQGNDDHSANSGAIYFYRAFNTPAIPGEPVLVQPVDAATGEAPATLSFTEVLVPGTTTIETLPVGPELSPGFRFKDEPIYYEISTTAGYNGDIEICLSYAHLGDVDPSELVLQHYVNGGWIDVSTTLEQDRMLCGQVSSLSPFVLVVREPALLVQIDIKPGSDPNSINLGSNGVVPVAIFSSRHFDATQVAPSTVTLADAGVKVRGNGTPQASVQDVNGDSFPDLVVQVDTQGLQLTAGDTHAILQGSTFAGQAIQGADTVRIVP